MNRRELLTGVGILGAGWVTGSVLLGVGIDGMIAGTQAETDTPVKHRKEQGFAAILDVATTAGEPRGTGISFPTPFSNYGPKSITYLIIEQYNITSISITKPTPFGARFTIVARDPGEFVCSIVWTAEE